MQSFHFHHKGTNKPYNTNRLLNQLYSDHMTSFGAEIEATQTETVLKAVFLPFISKSHLMRVVDTARLFSMHGVDVTIINTPANAALSQTTINRDSNRGHPIRTHIVKFPQVDGLPPGMESLDGDTPQHFLSKVINGIRLLQDQFEQLIREMKPDFIVTDMYYPWSVDVAAELGIPRLMCRGGSYLALAAAHSVQVFAPHKTKGDSNSSFLLPGLPHKLEMTRSQLPHRLTEEKPSAEAHLLNMIQESENKSYGTLFNSFYEVEGMYEEHYRTVVLAGTTSKTWSIGPISIWANQDDYDKAGRGKNGAKDEKGDQGKEGVHTWLDSKKEDSVLYLSFGTMYKFPIPQHVEIAHALEDSGHDFIWVVGKLEDYGSDNFLIEFEKRVKATNKGYVIWDWAPQLLILEHSAIGAVVTHCGWNTSMETLNAGLPMATWPIFAEQFFNEKLLVDVLGVGVAVGVKQWRNLMQPGDNEETVKRENIGKAIALLLGDGEVSLEMRRRAKMLSDAAKKAVQVGGSSHTNLKELIEGLKAIKLQKVLATTK